MGNNIKENNVEKSLTKKGEKQLTVHNKHKDILPIIRTATEVIFFTATFIVSVAVGYIFIFSVFN